MRITQTIAVLGLFAATATVACSDSGPLQPEALKKTLAGGSTAGAGTDTVGAGQENHDPRTLVGTVNGYGVGPDSESFEPVPGATVVISTPDDAAGTPGKELGRAVSKADGSFTLPGTYTPGFYRVDATPAAGSPFRGTHFTWGVSLWVPPTATIPVWLRRK